MNWQEFKLRLAIIPVCASLMIAACQIDTSLVPNERVESVKVQMKHQMRHRSTNSPESRVDDLSCADAAQRVREQCELYEQQILAAVVRLEVVAPSLDDPSLLIGRGGLGTIKDGQFIVVHNHFMVDLSIFADEAKKDLASLTLYGGNGYMLLRDVGPPLFEIVIEDQETLILDFGTNDEGEGFFDWYRVPSAPFRNLHEITIQPGSEVAQVNWDGQITYIDWVKVQEVITLEGVPRLVLANPIYKGSSGGGVFWNGIHIANNWKTIVRIDESGAETYQYSIAALNSVAVSSN